MASCYGCNADLPKGVPVIRRRVPTGGSSGVSWGKRVRVSSRSTYAERAFCEACAAAMDKRNSPGPIMKAFGAVAGVFLLIGIIGAATKKDNNSVPAAVAAPVVATGTSAPDMAVAAKKLKKKRRKAAVAAATPDDPNAVMPMTDEPNELVK